MRTVLNGVGHRGRVEIVANTVLAVLWALAATIPGGTQAVLPCILAAGFVGAAVQAYRKGQWAVGCLEPSDERSTVPRRDPLQSMALRGLAVSICSTGAFALGLLLVVTTPRADGANIGAGLILIVGWGGAGLGVVLTLQALGAPERGVPAE